MWLEKNFDELDTQMIGNDMKKYLFEVGTLKSDVKLLNEAEKDEVLELFIVEYRSIEQKLPVILALGNPDLQAHHWREIFQKMQKPGENLEF